MKKITALLLCFIWTTAYSSKLTVLLDWFPNPSHAPLFVAEQQGFFKEEQLDVTLIGPADPTDPPKLVAARKADIAITYQPQFMEQINQGLPLIMMGTLIDQPLNSLVVLKSNQAIHSLRDLKGKRIGYSGSSINNVTLKTMLKTVGLNLSDVELINVHYNLSQALLSKKIDAATGLMRNFELIQLAQTHNPAIAFYPEQYGVPRYSELIFVTHRNLKQDERLKRFLHALKKGTDYLRQHPESTWATFAKNHPELNNELNHQAWLATIPFFAKNPSYVNKKEWLQFGLFLQQNGLIKNTLPVNDTFIQWPP